ncbi:MAG: VIT domain-containing protein [Nitrospirota bacterium]
MKIIITRLTVTVLVFVLLVASNVMAEKHESEDRTLSPYFHVISDDADTDKLPLKSTSADVDIAGVIADVRVTQVYKNEGGRPIEAIYVFPASTRAAVYGMKMTIGERVINARVKKREDARREYEDAKRNGQSTSLLEQHRPNVFQMNVANIMPGDEINIELKYTELLVPTDRVYEFVYPTVVGPRYSNQPAETASPSEGWVQNPYLYEGESPDYTFDIVVNISAGLPINEVSCGTHKVNVNFDGTSIAEIKLDQTEKYGGNRDYILRYRLDGEQIESGLLLYEGEKENFFLLMMQPPERVSPSHIPGREYIFIVDVSGSMHGFPLDISKKLLRDLIGKLRPSDKFNVLLFAGTSSIMSHRSVSATPGNIKKAIHHIERQRGSGGTELLPALKRALALPETEGYSKNIVIATDGYVTVEEQAFDLIRSNIGIANMFVFGIGSSVNRHLIEGMSRAGMGEPFVITKPEEAAGRAEDFRKLVQTPVLTDIKVSFDGFRTYDFEPAGIPDVFAERPVIVFGKWHGQPEGKITLSGISGNRKWTDVIRVYNAKTEKSNSALRYLWARYRIKMLSDYNKLRLNDERTQEVTTLGLTYNLLTAYTSFVAVDSVIRNEGGELSLIRQPLPLPQGVSDYAVAGNFAPKAAAPLRMLRDTVGKKKEMFAEQESLAVEEDKVENEVVKVISSKGISKEKIKKVVERNIVKIDSCRQSDLRLITVKIVIDKSGNVKRVEVLSKGTKDRKVENCIVKEIRKWRFPFVQKAGEASFVLSIG